MLYETAARASEVLALTIDEPAAWDARRAPVRSTGGDTEWICWGSGTRTCSLASSRGLRQAGPVFLSERRPGPACPPRGPRGPVPLPPGRARLGYGPRPGPVHLVHRPVGQCRTSCATPAATSPRRAKASPCS